jgi:hypothetical protein
MSWMIFCTSSIEDVRLETESVARPPQQQSIEPRPKAAIRRKAGPGDNCDGLVSSKGSGAWIAGTGRYGSISKGEDL